MQQQIRNDPHSFRLHKPLNDNKRITEPKSQSVSSELEQEGIIAEAFARDGFFALRQCFDTDVLLPFCEFANDYFDQCFKDLYNHGHIEVPSYRCRETLPSTSDSAEDHADADHQRFVYTLGQGILHGFREIVMRSPGRYEVSLLHFDQGQNIDRTHSENLFHTYRLDEKIIQLVEPLKSLLPRLVGPKYTNFEDLKICQLSLLIATPNSSDQAWHADGGHMCLSKHLPCHCFNVFFPLQDTPQVLGPTEIRPASHFLTRNLGPMMLAAKCRKTLRTPVWPELAFGDIIVLDYRVLHRGRANLSGNSTNTAVAAGNLHNNNNKILPTNRNYLVVCYSEPWFKDILNFPKNSMYDPKRNLKE